MKARTTCGFSRLFTAQWVVSGTECSLSLSLHCHPEQNAIVAGVVRVWKASQSLWCQGAMAVGQNDLKILKMFPLDNP